MSYATLQVKTADGAADAFFAPPPKDAGACPGVVMYPDAFTLRPAMGAMAEKLAAQGYAVLVPNFLYRAGKTQFDPMTTFEVPASREQIMKLLYAYDDATATRDAKAWIEALHAQPNVKPGKVGVTGYCLGGRLATLTAVALPDQVAACAAFHAGRVVTDKPESLHRRIEDAPARFYFGVADNDDGCNADAQAQLKSALEKHHPKDKVELYAGAPHGFAMSDTKAFRQDASDKHWERMFAFFKETLS